MVTLFFGHSFSNSEIKDAYLKLKNYVYFDKGFLFYREKVAAFEKENDLLNLETAETEEDFLKVGTAETEEEQFNLRFKPITKKINQMLQNEKAFEKILKEINCYILPKKFENIEACANNQIISNRYTSKNYKVESVNYFVDAPVEVLLIDILWLTKIGYLLVQDKCEYLEKNFYVHSYANLLNIKNGKITKGINLFKPYINQYAKWRDNAIESVEKLHKEKKNSLIFSLDIKQYYYNISLDYDKIKLELELKYKTKNKDINTHENSDDSELSSLYLTDKLEQIHDAYRQKLNEFTNEFESNNYLPIGLLSSNILSNWYLKEFDKVVNSELKPAYYGRYVDDMIFVFEDKYECSKTFCNDYEECLGQANCKSEKLIEKFLLKNIKVFKPKYKQENKSNENKIIDKYLLVKPKQRNKSGKEANLYIQNTKIKIFIVDGNSTNTVLEQFKHNIISTGSEFKFLPDDSEIDKDFVKKTFMLNYSDSVNKLRSIEKCSLDKYSTSVYLAKKITYAKYLKGNIDFTKLDEITNYHFNGRLGLSLYSLWNKAFSYFTIVNSKESYNQTLKFYEKIKEYIQNKLLLTKDIKCFPDKLLAKMKQDLQSHLDISLALALSLNPNKFLNNEENNNKTHEISNIILNLRYANLYFHDQILFPGFNFTNVYFNNLQHNLIASAKIEKYDFINLISDNFGDYYKCSNSKVNDKVQIEERIVQLSPIHVLFDKRNFVNILNAVMKMETANEDKYKFDVYSDTESVEVNKDNNESDSLISNKKCNIIEINYKNNAKKIKFAIANLEIETKDIEQSIKNRSLLSSEKYTKLKTVINLAVENNADLLILPEASLPIEWLPFIYDYAKQHNLGIICGLEHYNNPKKYCFNFLATILPFEYKKNNEIQENQSSVFLRLRLKNHYAPSEEALLKEYNRKKPEQLMAEYDLIKWRGVYFSSYNCFELACIEDRILFKSKVDFITVSEFNRDLPYYSNIIESASRDLHCYIMQVNASQYGNSCIIAPKETKFATSVNIKGGDIPTVIIKEIDFRELRNFQYKETIFNKNDNFKPLPPCFDKSSSRLQLENID